MAASLAACGEIIAMAAASLMMYNSELARKVSIAYAKIDEDNRTVESICMQLLLHQQPVAGDLRVISAAMKMITDMERFCEYCTNIAEWAEFSVTGVHKECR